MKEIAILLAGTIIWSLSSLNTTETTEVKTPIVQKTDYSPIVSQLEDGSYTEKIKFQKIRQINFWENQIRDKGEGYLFLEKLARLHQQLFEVTGDIHELNISNDYYHRAALQSKGNYKASMLLAQSANYIQLHAFAKAKEKSEAAILLADDPFEPSMMLFDALMELGEYRAAEQIMETYSGSSSFDYLVRYGKFLDHQGDLEGAIAMTELARDQVSGLQKEKLHWVSTHLADMYGHRGDIRQSYEAYLNVLKEEPLNLHALRGIAWVAYAHDNNPEAAQEILQTIQSNTALPDSYLLLSELAAVEGDATRSEEWMSSFTETIKTSNLESLYHTYLTEVELDKKEDPIRALRMAQDEYDRRSTPETAILLANAYAQIGAKEKALEIVTSSLVTSSHEPGIQYQRGSLLYTLGQKRKGKKMLKEALEASYELGPNVTHEIKKLLEVS